MPEASPEPRDGLPSLVQAPCSCPGLASEPPPVCVSTREGTSGQLSSQGWAASCFYKPGLSHTSTQVSHSSARPHASSHLSPDPLAHSVFCSYFHRICVWPSCCRQGRAKPLCTYTEARVDAHLWSQPLAHLAVHSDLPSHSATQQKHEED